MIGPYLVLPVLLTIFLSFLVVRGGAIALIMTGMDRDKANFQALSAFSRAGFTTKEAELVVDNPRRRRIVTWLIILGNAGLVTIIVTATSSITTSRGLQLPVVIAAIIVGAYILYWLAQRRGFTRRWDRFVQDRLTGSRFFEQSGVEDLLHLAEGYGLVRVNVLKDSRFADCSLEEVTPQNEMWIVGIERGKKWLSLLEPQETIRTGDRVIVYGQMDGVLQAFAGR